MEPDEEVVSDVHLFLTEHDRIHRVPDRFFGIYPVVRSRFLFRDVTLSEEEKVDDEVVSVVTSARYDEDGDPILPRKKSTPSEVVYIEHAMSTHLPDVGLQVWPGCMILCDFIIDNRKDFDQKVVLELGAGVGLASVVMAMFAAKVIATDVNDDVLTTCSSNIALNKHLFNSTRFIDLNSTSRDTESDVPMTVQKLNWDSLNMGADPDIACDTSVRKNSVPNLPCSKSSTEDIEIDNVESLLDLDAVDILMASDVVYCDDATDCFFRAVYDIMRNSSRCKTLYVSIEKRLNFTLEDMDIACPAYEHFQDCVTNLCGLIGSAGEKFAAEIVPTIPQYFEYNRTRYLELWKITLEKNLQNGSVKCNNSVLS